MESRAKFLGHPIHQMLIVFPLGLLATAVIFDILHFIVGGDAWLIAARYMIAAGVIGGLVAAIFGLIDWLAIPSGTRAKRIGALHGIGNVIVVICFILSWLMRPADGRPPSTLGYFFSFVGAAIALVTGWLGGELVDRLGVGVDDGAGIDAPSSLAGPARARSG